MDGVHEGVTLHVFVASDQGKIKPHGYYQACKVTGRNTTPCKEIDIDGTTVIEIPWENTGNMEIRYVCITSFWKFWYFSICVSTTVLTFPHLSISVVVLTVLVF